jgi:hypothetical protein
MEQNQSEFQASNAAQNLLTWLRVAVNLLAARLAVYLCLLFMTGLSAWCMYDPSPMRIQTLGLFALTVFLPVLYRSRFGQIGTD